MRKIKIKVKSRDRFLSLRELHLVLEAAKRVGGYQGAFIRTLILTGQRVTETSLAKWEDLRLDDTASPLWLIPATNAKNKRAHDVPLSKQALASIEALRLSDNAEGYIFSGDGKRSLSSFSKLKSKLDKHIAEIERENKIPKPERLAPWTFHDLRRSAATGMADAEVQPHVIEATINHISGHKSGVAGIYNRSNYGEERRKALALWSRTVTEAKEPVKLVQLYREDKPHRQS